MLEVDDEVGYSHVFLKRIKVDATDDLWRRRGVVTQLHNGKFVRVKWSDEATPRLVLADNLAKPGANIRWAG